MTIRIISLSALACLWLTSCDDGGTSTRDMGAAAVEQARPRLNLGKDVPLEATVWIGKEDYDGQVVFCGAVSARSTNTRVAAQRFAATGDPIQWLIFEDAHDALITSQPDKFAEWQTLCGDGQEV